MWHKEGRKENQIRREQQHQRQNPDTANGRRGEKNKYPSVKVDGSIQHCLQQLLPPVIFNI